MRRLGNTGVDVFEDDLLQSVTALNDTPRKNIRSIVVSAAELKQATVDAFVRYVRLTEAR